MVGIPKKIGPAINQYLQQVVRGEKPIIDPEDEDELQNPVHVLGVDGAQLPGAGKFSF